MHGLEADDPRRMGDFTLIGRLGAGGMGQVFLGRAPGGRPAAVKVVRAALAEDPEFRARFRLEVAALHRVGGEWTAPVLGADTEAAQPWVATEYVPGPSLHQVVGAGYGPLPEATLHSLAGRLARALRAIHGAGLVHRDLKPSNILLTVDGPRVIDFGIARALDTVAGGLRTSTGVVLGSPGFMAPEQVRGLRVTPAADVFGLGSVLVYAATGRLPFGSAELGLHALMFRIAEEEPDLTGVPDTLRGLVTACLAKDPALRPTAEQIAARVRTDTADPWLPPELLAELGRLAARMLTAPTPVRVPARTPEAAPAAPAGTGRRWRRVVAAAVALAAVAAGTALYLRGDGGKEPAADGASGAPRGDERAVPEEFTGAWEGVVEGDPQYPRRTLRLEVTQGGTGDLVASYIDTDGEHQCAGRGALVSAGAGTLVVGEGRITAQMPQGRCGPAARQTLTARSPSVLTWTSGGLSADLHRSAGGPEAVPAEYVGVWVPANELYREKEMIRVVQGPAGGRLVRISAEAGMGDGTEQYCESSYVVGAVSPVLALGPGTYTAESGEDCRQPDSVFLTVADGRMLLYSMAVDAEPAEFVRKS
ncbi:serine/threonine-protein kinase [Streptomyces zhihengii]|uniref:Serine/threonine protein kinase n=1 Tax=Streptomyces zhihengii TaxID=1818004 RepID=A0ABS2UI93_9ACTN|nr:serine/threonine-protein kinase [Streptomyces zhihengii]MBM9617330.1 serine/threonine protein kinase [Streptomyces zhihengii]